MGSYWPTGAQAMTITPSPISMFLGGIPRLVDDAGDDDYVDDDDDDGGGC